MNGQGVPRDPVMAMRLFLDAFKLGATEAAPNIGHLYKEGLGVPRDYARQCIGIGSLPIMAMQQEPKA